MASIPRMTLGLVLGLAWSVGGLATMPAAAQDLIDCGMLVPGLPPELPNGGQIACGEPGVGAPMAGVPLLPTPVAGLPDLPAVEGPQDICDFYGFCGAAEPGVP